MRGKDKEGPAGEVNIAGGWRRCPPTTMAHVTSPLLTNPVMLQHKTRTPCNLSCSGLAIMPCVSQVAAPASFACPAHVLSGK